MPVKSSSHTTNPRCLPVTKHKSCQSCIEPPEQRTQRAHRLCTYTVSWHQVMSTRSQRVQLELEQYVRSTCSVLQEVMNLDTGRICRNSVTQALLVSSRTHCACHARPSGNNATATVQASMLDHICRGETNVAGMTHSEIFRNFARLRIRSALRTSARHRWSSDWITVKPSSDYCACPRECELMVPT